MKKIGFVGAGNMAGALLKGMLQAGQLKPDDVWASDPVDAQLRRMKRLHKIETTRVGAALHLPLPESPMQRRINVALSAVLVVTVVSLWIYFR